jgi:hypothetical protein
MTTRIATKLGVGIAGCAVAAAAILPVAPAEAAPVTVPAAPVVVGPSNVPMHWFGGGDSGWFGGGGGSSWLGGGESRHGGDFLRDIAFFFSFFHRPYDGPI